MRVLLGILTIVLIMTYAWAGTTGKLVGKVVDAKTKEPLIGVNVVILGTSPTLGASTDLDGNFTILNIRPGSYTVRASYIGYQSVSVTDVKISIDQTTTQNFELSSSSVELEEVVVVAQRDAIKKDITSSQSTVSSEQIESLPVAELDGVLQLQAGVTRDADGGFHIRGGRTTEIAYWVNGISITDSYDNSRGVQIDNNSIQELQVISGTFNAEFGNAMSGIVNTVTKEGGDEYHGSLTVYSGDHLSTFTDYFPHIDRFNAIANKNVQASLSGGVPFTNNAIKFFVNGRYYYDDGYLFGERRYNVDGSPGNGEIVSMNWRKNLYGQTNISFIPAQGFKVNAEALYSKEDFQDYSHEYRWNPGGNVNKFSESGNATATLTHMISPTTFYTVKGSYFFKDFNEYLYENPRDTRYLHPDSLILPTSYAFRIKGTNLHRFYRETNTFLGKLDFTSQISESHLLKLGAEVRTHELNFDDYTLEPLRINNIPVEPFRPSAPGETQPNREKYHNEPFEASAYLQDKIEYENVIINIGLRFDYFNSNGKILVEPRDPNIYEPLREELEPLTIAEREPYFYKAASAKFQLSPRFGIAYPISDAGVIHFSYGHFLQIPPFQYLFNKGPYKVPHQGINLGVYGNPDLEPQKTVMYEIGFRQEFSPGFVADFTAFYRDVRDWVTAGPPVETINLVTYSTYKNQ
ncbi:MAG: TonB-dependent receptor, partial [Nitrososphaera sp.]|nr:TonB-dependent receptor [Nitrososphaera sp.]